ncbi:hypothetical protein HPB49_013519 [Dermacentor silvarum]|uniref:Uncharacterized protein n=1 Tax=Dermacentor silvarum TaxID=543639 RepID=A0ACB8C3V9_DERSI|nr:hypothetical protein HPB49_013519 [Dermacentor silvarum]
MHRPHSDTAFTLPEQGGITNTPWSSNRSNQRPLSVPATYRDDMRETPPLPRHPMTSHGGMDPAHTYSDGEYGRTQLGQIWPWTNQHLEVVGTTNVHPDDVESYIRSLQYHPEIIQQQTTAWNSDESSRATTLPLSHDRNLPNASGWHPSYASQEHPWGDRDDMPSSRFPSAAPNTKNAYRSAALPEKVRELRSASIKQRPDDAPLSHYETANTMPTQRRQSVAPRADGMPAVAPPGIKKPTNNTDNTTTPPYETAQTRVTSQERKPHDEPQPYGGFAGVPAYAEEPNVIVFVPRPPSMRGRLAQPSIASPLSREPLQGAPGARPVSPTFYSPTVLSLDQPDRRQSLQPREKIPFTRVYVLCCVVIATFIVPFGTIFVSYVTTHGGITRVAPSLRTFNYRLTLPPTQPTTSTSPPPSAACVDRVHLADVQGAMNLTASAHTPYGPIYRNLFCIYNNSRVRKGPGRHFIPADLPLTYCTNIIYWSLAIKNGTVESRTPVFDHTQGLSKLRHMSATAGHSNSVILAAIGGYPEDSPEFSLLGHDAGAMSRFAASSLDVVKRHRLNGTAIHWVSPDSQCQDPHDEDTLLHIVAVQRHIFDLNGYHAVIAVFLPPASASARSLWSTLEPFVDYVFVETQALGLMPSGFDLTVCDVISQRASALLSNLSTSPQNAHKICSGVSLAPWLVNGNVSQGLNNLSTSFAGQYPGAPGTAAVFELCTGPICAVHQGVQQCVAFTQQTLYGTQSPISMYLFLNEPMLNTIMLWGAARGPGPNGTCVVLYDLDLDLYDRGCSNLSEWMSLRRVQAALAGNPLISALTQVPAC